MSTEPQILAHPLSSVICLLSSAERSEVPARRETIVMQNKPNLLDNQMNVNKVLTKGCKDSRLLRLAENKPNQTQIFSNGLNNRKSNLRLCTNKENVRNSRPSLGKTSRYKGVYRDKREKKFIARIEVDGKKYCLGYFDDEVEAAIAYDIKAMVFFGEFAYLNFPDRKIRLISSNCIAAGLLLKLAPPAITIIASAAGICGGDRCPSGIGENSVLIIQMLRFYERSKDV